MALPTGPRQLPVDAASIVRRARRLHFLIRPEIASQLSGAYHGARPGIGLTFAELRPYEPGDEVRHIDWRVTARQGKPYVRRYVEERALVLWIVIDVSGSMRFGPEGRTKADRAAQAAALLATAAIHNGDQVGLLLVSDRLEADLAPGIGTRHLRRLIRGLAATPTTSTKTQLDSGLTQRLRTARRSLIVVISDFKGDQSSGLWRQAARRNEVVALRLVEPREETLPDAGLIRIESAEEGHHGVFDSSSPRLRENYSTRAEQGRLAFTRWCAKSGVSGITLSTANDPVGPLIEMFSRRPSFIGGH